MKKAIWFALMVALLGVVIYFYEMDPTGDTDILLFYGLMVFNFPLGITPVLIVNVISKTMAWQLETSLLTIIVEWAVVGLFGYFQWFVLLPRLIAWFKKKGR